MKSIKDVYASVFNIEGYDVDTAEDGAEALQKTKKKEYDLILLDILMLDVNGIEFLEKFQRNKKHPNTKILVVSNLASKDNPHFKDKALELGASDYLVKSQYSPKEIVAAAKKILTV